ncbi:MAG: bifunctional precorrin-2 dehydrogenase/sirohydrochlorin ferrochelatase [bacterium]
MNIYYPIFLDLQGERTLVIGGGRVAERKARSLLKSHAHVMVISPELTSGLRRLVQAGRIIHKQRKFISSDLNGVRLIICATNDTAVNRKAAGQAEKRGILYNVVDVPELCNFIVPSTVRRGDLTVAISTGGSSPALAKKIRREIETLIGPEYKAFLKLLRDIRPIIQREIPSKDRRMRAYGDVIESETLSLVRAGRIKEARQKVREILKNQN